MGEVYTVRGGIYDADRVPASAIAALYFEELARAGFHVVESPTVSVRPTQAEVSVDGPFKRIRLTSPPFDPVEQSRDTRVPYEEDHAALAEAGRGTLTTFVWNLCGPDAAAGTLRDIFRRRRVEGWLKLSPIVSTWSAAPVQLAGYPARPPQPGCTPRVAKDSSGGSGLALGLGLLFAGGLGALALRKRRRA